MASWNRLGAEAQIITCGRRASDYFRNHPGLVMHFAGTSADPDLQQARMISSYVCREYEAEKLDRVVIVYHHAKNRVDQELRVETLLPLDPEAIAMAHGPRKNTGEGPERVSSSFKFVPLGRARAGRARTELHPDRHPPGAHRLRRRPSRARAARPCTRRPRTPRRSSPR